MIQLHGGTAKSVLRLKTASGVVSVYNKNRVHALSHEPGFCYCLMMDALTDDGVWKHGHRNRTCYMIYLIFNTGAIVLTFFGRVTVSLPSACENFTLP